MTHASAILAIMPHILGCGDTITSEAQLKSLSYEKYTRNKEVLEGACRKRLIRKDEYERMRKLFVNWEQHPLAVKVLLALLVQILRESTTENEII